MMKLTNSLIVAVLLAFSLAACSGDEEPGKDKPKADSSKSPSAQESVNEENVSPPNLPKKPRIRGEKGALKDVTFEECGTKAGPQTTAGEVTSSAKKAVDYLVSVSWTTGSGDVMGRGCAVIEDLQPGATETWEISAKVKDGATQCVNGASYGRIG